MKHTLVMENILIQNVTTVPTLTGFLLVTFVITMPVNK